MKTKNAQSIKHAILDERWEETITIKYWWVRFTLNVPEKLVQRLARVGMEPGTSLMNLSAFKSHEVISRRSDDPHQRWIGNSSPTGVPMRKRAKRWEGKEPTLPIEIKVREELWEELKYCADGACVSVNQWALACFDYSCENEEGAAHRHNQLIAEAKERFPSGRASISEALQFLEQRETAKTQPPAPKRRKSAFHRFADRLKDDPEVRSIKERSQREGRPVKDIIANPLW